MHAIKRPFLWIAFLLLMVLLVSAAGAADSPQKIVRHVEGSAGQKVAAGPFVLSGTLGEPIVGPFVTAGGNKVASGYWQGITRYSRLFLPVIVR